MEKHNQMKAGSLPGSDLFRIWRNLALILALSVIGTVAAMSLNMHETLHTLTHTAELHDIDEIIIFFPLFLSLGLLWCMWVEKKWKEKEIITHGQTVDRLVLLSLAIEQSSEGIAVVDLKGQIQFSNDAFARMHGYRPDEFYGRHLSIFHTPEQMPAVEAANRQIRETGDFKGEIEHVRRNGTVFPALMHNSILKDGAGNMIGIVASMNDITVLKETQSALEFKNSLLSAQQEASIDGILIVDEAGEIISFNQRFVKMWDIPSHIVKSRSDKQALRSVLDKLVDPEAFIDQIKYLYSHRTEISHEEIMLFDGRLFDRYSAPVFGQKNEYFGRIWYFRDITKIRDAYQKVEETQAQLVQSGKLASIGELASGVAHELNQPLMVIRGTTQLIRRSVLKNNLNDDELLEQLDPIIRNTKRMMNIIGHLRSFSRQSTGQFTRLDISKVVKESFTLISEQLRLRNIEVVTAYASDLPGIQGDVNQLEQVVINLITNARDAITSTADCGLRTAEYKGKIEIITAIAKPQSKIGMGFIEVLFKDNGCGIPADHLEKIFDPFFTTKEVGRGTGLGLSISYGIIKEHGGEIEVAETGPDGTTFRIRLPIVDC